MLSVPLSGAAAARGCGRAKTSASAVTTYPVEFKYCFTSYSFRPPEHREVRRCEGVNPKQYQEVPSTVRFYVRCRGRAPRGLSNFLGGRVSRQRRAQPVLPDLSPG